MRVFFTNLGCKLNQAEVDHLARRFVAAGHRLAPCLEEADLHVINSCTVTHLAARDSRKTARRGARLPNAPRTVLTGCYASHAPQEAAALAGVDLVVDNTQKHQLLEQVHAFFPEVQPSTSPVPVPYVPLDYGHVRALVKVEDGCNMRCSFCIIPSTRGRQRSRSIAEVVAEVQSLASGGYPEVVVTGVQISEYDDAGQRLYDLVSALLADTDVRRLRLTSIAPWKLDRRLLDLWQDRRLCRHIHMSLQSGCSATLRRMRRPYSAAAYGELASTLRQAIPGLALTTDVIVGFPGESDDEFQASLDFVESMAFARPHVFTYSPRQGTDAATHDQQVEPTVKKERVHRMLAVANASQEAFHRRQVGEDLDVVWEERRGGWWTGLSDNYVRVRAAADQVPDDLTGRLETVTVEDVTGGGVSGRRL